MLFLKLTHSLFFYSLCGNRIQLFQPTCPCGRRERRSHFQRVHHLRPNHESGQLRQGQAEGSRGTWMLLSTPSCLSSLLIQILFAQQRMVSTDFLQISPSFFFSLSSPFVLTLARHGWVKMNRSFTSLDLFPYLRIIRAWATLSLYLF